MDPFFYLILLAGALAGASCGLLGVYLVGLRLPFVGIFISHAAMAGTIFSSLLGLSPIWGPVVVSAVASASLAAIRPEKSRLDPNVALAVLFSLMLGLTFLGIGLLAAAAISILSGPMIRILYGASYAGARPALRLLAFGLVAMFPNCMLLNILVELTFLLCR